MLDAKVKPEKEISDVFILEDGRVVLRNTLIGKKKIKQQYYVLTTKGLQALSSKIKIN